MIVRCGSRYVCRVCCRGGLEIICAFAQKEWFVMKKRRVLSFLAAAAMTAFSIPTTIASAEDPEPSFKSAFSSGTVSPGETVDITFSIIYLI